MWNKNYNRRSVFTTISSSVAFFGATGIVGAASGKGDTHASDESVASEGHSLELFESNAIRSPFYFDTEFLPGLTWRTRVVGNP